ncbi:MAG: TOBE domain-containing protein [Candidatus Marinimicrobia bacterium]|nr:TOBE domain-containing protein [Candidatus Neomarinimicrobiota bacterium]
MVEIIVGIRPEDINIEPTYNNAHRIQASLELVEPLGNEALIYLKSASQSLISITRSYDPQKLSDSQVSVYINLDKIHLFDAATKKRLSD